MRIAIITPSASTYSETFIDTHIQRLPFDVETLCGGQLNLTDSGDLFHETCFERIYNYPKRKLSLFDSEADRIGRQARWLVENKIEVVLAEFGVTGTKIMPACEKAGVPLVVHFHGYDAHNREAIEAFKANYEKMFSTAAAVVGVSKTMVDQIVNLGAPREKVHYIPSFVDPEIFTQQVISPHSQTFLAVGRFVEKKAPHLTILAFAEALERFPDARLEMVGDGFLWGPCKWLVKSLGIEKSVFFHGARDHRWVAEAMGRARGFVQHSVAACNGDSEGTPVAVLEAQCSGLPVVATSHTGIADVVVNGVTGFLCREGDVQKMSENMMRLFHMNQSEYSEMSKMCRKRIETHFGKKDTLDRLAALLESVV